MPIIDYRGMVFEWFDTKFELVAKKRQLSFEEVCSVGKDSGSSCV